MNFPQLKPQVIECLRDLEEIGKQLDSAEKVKFVQPGIDKLENNTFTIVIAGEFSRGKTTFLKALTGGLGFLPDANQANTAVITAVEYSDDPEKLKHFRVIYRDEREDEILPIEKIRRFVEQDPRVKQKEIDEIERICIWSDVPFLKEGIQVVDSPGLGSVYPHHGEITYNQIAQSDACIFLMLIRPAAGDTEIKFLKDIQKYLNKVFFIINQCDMDDFLKKPEVLKEEIDKIAAQLSNKNISGFSREKLFPMSSQWAFAGKAREKAKSILLQRKLESWEAYFKETGTKGFEELHALSGIEAFKNFFDDFIYKGEKAREILMAPIKRIIYTLVEFGDSVERRLTNLSNDISIEELEEKIDLVAKRLELFRAKSEDSLKETGIKFEELIQKSEEQSQDLFDQVKNSLVKEIHEEARSFENLSNEDTIEKIHETINRGINRVIDNLIDMIQIGIDDLIVQQQHKDQENLSDIFDQIESDFQIDMPLINLPKVYFNEAALEKYDRRINLQEKEKEHLKEHNKEISKELDKVDREYEELLEEKNEVKIDVTQSFNTIKELNNEKPTYKSRLVTEQVGTYEEPYEHIYNEKIGWRWNPKFWPHKKKTSETRYVTKPIFQKVEIDNQVVIDQYNKEIREERKKFREYETNLLKIENQLSGKKKHLDQKKGIKKALEDAEKEVSNRIRKITEAKEIEEQRLKENQMKQFAKGAQKIVEEMVDDQIRFGKREIRKNVRKYYQVFKEGIHTEYDSKIIGLKAELDKLMDDKNLQKDQKESLIQDLSQQKISIESLVEKTTNLEKHILSHQEPV